MTMSEPKLECKLDANKNPILYEIDSRGNRRKVATLYSDGHIIFEETYESRSVAEKDAFRKAIRLCPKK